MDEFWNPTGGLAVAVTGVPGRTAVVFAVASAVIHIGYELALMNSYRLGAFNQVYPIARGTSPLVVAVGAYFFAVSIWARCHWQGWRYSRSA